ncbi:hypothetical protein BH18ACI4_BH18ACI4_08550 [soil metagenome]
MRRSGVSHCGEPFLFVQDNAGPIPTLRAHSGEFKDRVDNRCIVDGFRLLRLLYYKQRDEGLVATVWREANKTTAFLF